MTYYEPTKSVQSSKQYDEQGAVTITTAMIRPDRVALYAVILLICAVTGLFSMSVLILQDHPSLAAIVAGEGSVLFALVGLAIVLARGHFAAVENYNSRIASMASRKLEQLPD